METTSTCMPCFVGQAVRAAEEVGLDDGQTRQLLTRTFALLSELDWTLPPPVAGAAIQRELRAVSGLSDPYLARKISDTRAALELLPRMEEAVAASPLPFAAAVRLAIAGNAIDLGIGDGGEVPRSVSVERALELEIDEDAARALQRRAAAAGSILFLADNAGELVFDRPLLEALGRDRVTVAVRGGPVINDATLDDARRSGVTDLFRTVENGSDIPGTWLEGCSPEFVDLLTTADLVVAKGQGNFETLAGRARPVTFLLLAKCGAVAEYVGVPRGAPIVREISPPCPGVP